MGAAKDNKVFWSIWMGCGENGCPWKKARNDFLEKIGYYKEYYEWSDLAMLFSRIPQPYKRELEEKYVAMLSDSFFTEVKTALRNALIDEKSGMKDIVETAFIHARMLYLNNKDNYDYRYTNGATKFDSEDWDTIKSVENKLMSSMLEFYLDSEETFMQRKHTFGDTLARPKYGEWYDTVVQIFWEKGYHPDLWNFVKSYIYNKLKIKFVRENALKRHEEWLEQQKITQEKHAQWVAEQEEKKKAIQQAQAQAQAQAQTRTQTSFIPQTTIETSSSSGLQKKILTGVILVGLGGIVYELLTMKR